MIEFKCFVVVITLSTLIAISSGIESNQPLEKLVTAPPYKISLEHNRLPVCSGTILREKWIITAASCVTGSNKDVIPAYQLKVRAGSNALSSGGVVVEVARVIVHEKFKFFNSIDLALLELKIPLPLSHTIETIKIRKENVPAGFLVTVYGWGLGSSTRGTWRSENLLKSTPQIISQEDCAKRFMLSFDQIICLDHPVGEEVCHRDSGGGAVFKNELIGVASFVKNICGSRKPDVYVGLSKYLDWINNNMN